MKTNVLPKRQTHEGGRAANISHEQQLRRSVMSCMLWESEFYEGGVEIGERIASLVPQCSPEFCYTTALRARNDMKLRHAPLWLAVNMARHKTHRKLLGALLPNIIQRADELAEFLALYWKDGKKPLAAQIKKGLAKAFQRFDAYQLGKYNRDGAVKLRDVLFLCHAKPKDEQQAAVWKQLVEGTLPTPDTWETNLSAGKDKAETWVRLINEKKLGALALLRNLRNMIESGVDDSLIRQAIVDAKVERVLPFRFIAAARYGKRFEPQLEQAMFRCVAEQRKLRGVTLLLVDVSGSMEERISGKSEMTRMDAACGLAMLLREICDSPPHIWTFSNGAAEVPPRRGFALRDAVVTSQAHGGTRLSLAIGATNYVQRDRTIIITDEQTHDGIAPVKQRGYCINVASAKNGVGYGSWLHIDGWSESVIDYLMEYEQETGTGTTD